MQGFKIEPEILCFETCKEFAQAFQLNEQDLVLTNAYIYQPYFQQMGLTCHTIFQEKYGIGEPSDVMAETILKESVNLNCKRIIAIGGGTIIDLAKVLAVADTTDVDALYTKMPNLNKAMELVIIPTTCGTGSEVTNISVLNRTRMGTKMGMVAPAMYADYAVLIPELLQSLPANVFATSSIDALVHAVESALSPNASAHTKLFSYKAIEMLIKGYQKIARDGLAACKNLMGDFLIASNFAGLAFGTAGCGTVHAIAYPLGGQYHVAHGESNYAAFTGVMRAYMQHRTDGEIATLNACLADLLGCDPEGVYVALEGLLNQILPKKALREYGIKREDLPVFSKSVIEHQQRLLKNSFVPMTEEMILKIYQDLY